MSTGVDGNAAEPVASTTPPLDKIYFYLTQGCNLACRHCWLAPKFDPAGSRYPVLPVEVFETVIREAKPLGLSGVKLTGGEPLLHPEIDKLLAIVRREELRLTLETNGVLCTPELAVEIAQSSPGVCVSVSLDGADRATHEWVRGVPGSFEQALGGVRNLVAAGIPPQIIMSLMRVNAGQVEAMVRLAQSLGASSVKFNVIQPTGRGEGVLGGAEGLQISEMIELGRLVELKLAPTVPIKLFFDYPMAFRPLSRLADGAAGGRCGILSILGVLASGEYALCGIGMHVHELTFGMAGQDALAEVWRDAAALRELRAGMPDRLTGVCADCIMRAQCFGTCVAQSYYRTQSLWSPFWFCEQASATGQFPPSRMALPAGSANSSSEIGFN